MLRKALGVPGEMRFGPLAPVLPVVRPETHVPLVRKSFRVQDPLEGFHLGSRAVFVGRVEVQGEGRRLFQRPKQAQDRPLSIKRERLGRARSDPPVQADRPGIAFEGECPGQDSHAAIEVRSAEGVVEGPMPSGGDAQDASLAPGARGRVLRLDEGPQFFGQEVAPAHPRLGGGVHEPRRTAHRRADRDDLMARQMRRERPLPMALRVQEPRQKIYHAVPPVVLQARRPANPEPLDLAGGGGADAEPLPLGVGTVSSLGRRLGADERPAKCEPRRHDARSRRTPDAPNA